MSTAGIENINWQLRAGKDWKQAEDNTLMLTWGSILRIHLNRAAADDRDCRDMAEFLESMWQCFDNADKALTDERSSIPLDYLQSRLEDHFQVVNAIAIAIRDNSSAE